MLDLNGGTGLFGDFLFIVAYTLKSSFYKGRRRVIRLEARRALALVAPEGRLCIDGETYRGE